MTETLAEEKKLNAGATARRQQREANIELVRKLLVRGIHRTMEIQAYFRRLDPPIHVTDRTIARYKSTLKRRNAKRLVEKEELNKTMEELAIELKTNYEEITKEAWRIFHNNESKPTDKLKALSLVKETSDSWVEKLQSLGFADKAAEKHQMLDANGQPTEPTVNIDTQKLNVAFISFIKDQWQNPIGHTNSHEPVSRKVEDGSTRPITSQAARTA